MNVLEHHRARGKTVTDDNVPFTLRSPAKLLAQGESRTIQHSQSFTNLHSSKEHVVPPKKVDAGLREQSSTSVIPRLGKLRRRSTLHWSGASPMSRQKKLEDVAESRLADTWFSLHVEGQKEPLYISEEIENAMNPSFRAFDLNALGPAIARDDRLLMKLWAKASTSESYVMLLEIDFNLRSLQFLGKSLDNFHHPLPANCVLFHMSDGIYTSFTDLPPEEHPTDFLRARSKAAAAAEQFTSSFDALMRLSNLDECIQDALATREKLETRINGLIAEHRAEIQPPRQVVWDEEAVQQRQRAANTEKRQLRTDQKRREDLKTSLESRRKAMKGAREDQAETLRVMSDADNATRTRRSKEDKTQERSTGQIRRICEDLLLVYPIEAIPKKPLHFTIRGLPLPNSKFDDIEDREVVAAALGFTAQLVVLLSHYLAVPLPYPIRQLASNSLIEDPISVALPQRLYPLYPINVTYRFEYGVFLLNKDIEFLMDRHNLRMLDIRHTLPNLKYLTYVLTAGSGDLPARKAGGIKGLLPTLSRRSSEDSVANGIAFSGHRGSDGSIPSISGKIREKEDNIVHGSAKHGPTFRSSALGQTL